MQKLLCYLVCITSIFAGTTIADYWVGWHFSWWWVVVVLRLEKGTCDHKVVGSIWQTASGHLYHVVCAVEIKVCSTCMYLSCTAKILSCSYTTSVLLYLCTFYTVYHRERWCSNCHYKQHLGPCPFLSLPFSLPSTSCLIVLLQLVV